MGAAVRLPAARGGILPGLLALVAAGAALIALAWMLLLPVGVTTHLRQLTGFDTDVQSLMVNPFTGRVVARGFVLGNPPTFPRKEFLQLREFEAETELRTLLTDKPVIRRLRLDVTLLALVKRADGRTNNQVLQDSLVDRPASAQPGQPRALLIRRLELKIDRFMLIDHSRHEPVEREFALQLVRTYENVTDSRRLLISASLDELVKTGGAVGNLLSADVAGAIDRAIRAGTDVVREPAREPRQF